VRAWRLAGGAQMLLPVGNRRLGTGVAAAVLVLALVGSSSAHSGKFARLVPLNPCTAPLDPQRQEPRTAHPRTKPCGGPRGEGTFDPSMDRCCVVSTEAVGASAVPQPSVPNSNHSDPLKPGEACTQRTCRSVLVVHARAPT